MTSSLSTTALHDAPGWRIAADIGGTFTDIVALGPDRSLLQLKVPSTPSDYAVAITESLARALDRGALGLAETFVHGTTVATNAILSGATSPIALVTTAGFKDVLEIRRSRRPTLYDLTWRPPPPLVPRRLRFEVSERVAADGAIVEPLEVADVEACVAALRGTDVVAVAVCLVNSYANPDHERRVAEMLRKGLKTVDVAISSDLVPEPREFERTSTTVIDALLLPIVDDYLRSLESALSDIGLRSPVHVMQSDGTTVTAALARAHPFTIIESGPAAGVVAAARLAEEMDRPAVVAFDMGGTTAKASLIERFRPSFADELEVGDSLNRAAALTRGSGYSVRSPCVDISEVGAGGGSIAWVDGGGSLRVGPRSAGSEPGPACYGGGGTDPTTTDAHVVLGYLNPAAIAGGTKPITAGLAHEAVGRLAAALGTDAADAAFGIFSVANATMRRAVRTVSVERGRDPRDFTLFAFGGAGGLHAAALAEGIGMTEVVVPMAAGLFSSLGLLCSDLAVTRLAALRSRLTPDSLARAWEIAEELRRDAERELRSAHNGVVAPRVRRGVALQYVGQSTPLSLALDGSDASLAGACDRLAAAFHAEHRRVRGQAAEREPIELVGVRVSASWERPAMRFSEIASRGAGAVEDGAPPSRRMYFGPTHGWRDAPVLDRRHLGADPLAGPLVIEDPDATIVVPPGWSCRLHETGAVVLRAQGPVAPGAPESDRREPIRER